MPRFAPVNTDCQLRDLRRFRWQSGNTSDIPSFSSNSEEVKQVSISAWPVYTILEDLFYLGICSPPGFFHEELLKYPLYSMEPALSLPPFNPTLAKAKAKQKNQAPAGAMKADATEVLHCTSPSPWSYLSSWMFCLERSMVNPATKSSSCFFSSVLARIPHSCSWCSALI